MGFDMTVAGDQPTFRFYSGIPAKGSPLTQCPCLISRRDLEADIGKCTIVPRSYKSYDDLCKL